MAASCLRRAMAGPATFTLFVRRLPADRGFLVATGLQDCLRFLEDLAFTGDDLDYLRRFGDRVRARRLHGGLDDPHADGGEHGVEGSPGTLRASNLVAALRVWAKGLFSAEAAIELLIGHRLWLYRDDFREIAGGIRLGNIQRPGDGGGRFRGCGGRANVPAASRADDP